jgi:hypothetical protein
VKRRLLIPWMLLALLIVVTGGAAALGLANRAVTSTNPAELFLTRAELPGAWGRIPFPPFTKSLTCGGHTYYNPTSAKVVSRRALGSVPAPISLFESVRIASDQDAFYRSLTAPQDACARFGTTIIRHRVVHIRRLVDRPNVHLYVVTTSTDPKTYTALNTVAATEYLALVQTTEGIVQITVTQGTPISSSVTGPSFALVLRAIVKATDPTAVPRSGRIDIGV